MTLARYLTRAFMMRFLAALLVFAALLQLLDLLDSASDVLERKGDIAALLSYAAFRLPTIIDQVLPIAVLVGALLTLHAMAHGNEIVAMKSSGLTAYRILALLMPAAVIIATSHFLLGDRVTPLTERAFLTWWAASSQEAEQADERLWVRDGPLVVAVDRVSPDGRRLDGVALFRRDAPGRLAERIVADAGEYEGDGWRLRNVRRTTLGPSAPETITLPSMEWRSRLTPPNFVELAAPTSAVSVRQLEEIVRGERLGANGPAYYETRLQHKYAGLLAVPLLLLLAAPALYGIRRRGQLLLGLTLGLAVGFCYLFAGGFMLALGEAGVMPPALAAWAPILLFAGIGGSILVHLEG